MIQPQDQETLDRLLKTSNTPEDVVQEYEGRLRWYHSDGKQGPLGTLAIIDLLRFLGYELPAKQEVDQGSVDWRSLPTDSTVRVMAGPFYGSMQKGAFVGFGNHEQLLVRLDETKSVVECRRDMVEYVGIEEPGEPLTALQQSFSGVHESEEVFKGNGWDGVDQGADVYVNIDGDIQEGKFDKVLEDGRLKVKIGRKKHECNEEDVALMTGELAGVE